MCLNTMHHDTFFFYEKTLIFAYKLQPLTHSLLKSIFGKVDRKKQIYYSILSFWHLELRGKMELFKNYLAVNSPNSTYEAYSYSIFLHH